MRTRGWGRLAAAIVAIVLAVAVGAPELAAPAGAVTMRSTRPAELRSRPAARGALHAKRRRAPRRGLRHISAAKKRALLVAYIRTHPGVVAAHARRPGATLAKRLKLAAYLRAHHTKAKRAPVRRPAARPAARPKKKKKGAATSSWHRSAELLVGASIGLIALFLIASGALSGPRSRARARARRQRRTLVTR
jgi:hypothetical protein